MGNNNDVVVYVYVYVWLPVKLVLPTYILSRLRAADQLSPHSAVGRPGPPYGAAPGRLSQGQTQRIPDPEGPGRPSDMAPVFAHRKCEA